MRVIIKEPKKEAKIIEIEDDLNTYYQLIDCSTIDIVRVPFHPDIAIIVDDEGALKDDSKPNFWRGSEVIYGTAILAGVDGENLIDLNERQINYMLAYFKFEEI